MDGHGKLFVLVLTALLVLQTASALPDSSTGVSGTDCRRGHSLSYSYSVTAPKTVNVGDEFTISLQFNMGGDSRVKSAPRAVTAILQGSGIENPQSKKTLQNSAEWTVKAAKAGTLSLSFTTELSLTGDGAHPGYKVTYADSVEFTIVSSAPVTTPPVTKPPVVDNAPQNTSSGVVNNTVVTPPLDETDNDDEEDEDEEDGTNNTNIQPPAGVDTGNNTQTVTEEFVVDDEFEPDQTSWYLTRGIGLIAYTLLFLSVLIALLKRLWPASFARLFKYHHDISLMAVVLGLLHGLTNMADSFMWNLSLGDVFIPRFGTNSQVLITLGIIGFYIMALVTLTSVGKRGIRKLGPKGWRLVHITSYVSFLLVFTHSVLLGTDVKYGGTISVLIWQSGIIVFVLTAYMAYKRLAKK